NETRLILGTTAGGSFEKRGYKGKPPNGSFSTRPALSPTTFAQVICLPQKKFQSFPPIRSPDHVELTRRLNYPSSLGFEELQSHRVAVATQWNAVGHSS